MDDDDESSLSVHQRMRRLENNLQASRDDQARWHEETRREQADLRRTLQEWMGRNVVTSSAQADQGLHGFNIGDSDIDGFDAEGQLEQMVEEDSRMPQSRFTSSPYDRLNQRLDNIRTEYGTNVSEAPSSYAQAYNCESMPQSYYDAEGIEQNFVAPNNLMMSNTHYDFFDDPRYNVISDLQREPLSEDNVTTEAVQAQPKLPAKPEQVQKERDLDDTEF